MRTGGTLVDHIIKAMKPSIQETAVYGFFFRVIWTSMGRDADCAPLEHF